MAVGVLDPDLAAKARRVRLRARRLSSALFAGAFESAFKGRGVELDQVREYQPGDDVRRIDWNVTARAHSGEAGARAFVKEHRVERELTVYVLVDMSGSGAFGSGMRTKNEVAAELASVLAFAAMAGNDRVGVGLFTDHVESFIPPRKGRAHIARIIRELLTFEPRGVGTNIDAALAHFMRVQRRRAVVFLVSDFMTAGYDDRLRAVAHRHELVALRPFDPRENELPAIGLVHLRDTETGETRLVDTSDVRVREDFADAARRRDTALQERLRELDVPLLTIATDGAYIDTLVKFFRGRTRR